jgi:cytochrome c-type biogenesis protein CcmE
MSEDSLQGAVDILRSPVSMDVIGVWALVGVAAAAALSAAAGRRPYSLKLDASLLVVGVAGGWLFWSSLKPVGQYYKDVDEVVANAKMMRDRRMHLQVHGRIVPWSIEHPLATSEYRFKMESCEPRPCATIEVRYFGAVPDTFASGAEIIARGSLDGDGRLQVVPDGIMTKCPSKYDADPSPSLGPAAPPVPRCPCYRSGHGQVGLPRFQDTVPRKGRGREDRHRQLGAGRGQA